MGVVTVGSTSPAEKRRRGPGRKTLAKTLAAVTRPATTAPPTDPLTTFGSAPTVSVQKTRSALECWEVHVPSRTYAFEQPAPHEADAQEAVQFQMAALRRAWIAKHASCHHEVTDERPMQVVCEIATPPLPASVELAAAAAAAAALDCASGEPDAGGGGPCDGDGSGYPRDGDGLGYGDGDGDDDEGDDTCTDDLDAPPLSLVADSDTDGEDEAPSSP